MNKTARHEKTFAVLRLTGYFMEYVAAHFLLLCFGTHTYRYILYLFVV